MTYAEIADRVFAAAPKKRQALADELLKEYTQPDVDDVRRWLFEGIAVADPSPQEI